MGAAGAAKGACKTCERQTLMIRLQRIRTKQAIQAVFLGAKRIEKALTLLVEADAQRSSTQGAGRGPRRSSRSSRAASVHTAKRLRRS
jgi:hypothetical protein